MMPFPGGGGWGEEASMVLVLSLYSFGLSANQPAVLFSYTKSAPATNYLFSRNKSAPATAKRTQ